MHANVAPLTTQALRSRALGIVLAASFGAFWATTGLNAWRGAFTLPGFVLTLLVLTASIVAAARLVRLARRSGLADAPAPDRRRTRRRFLLIFIGEIVAMNIAAWWLVPQHVAYLMPVIAIIVGLHFYPLAPIFRAPHYRVTATVMSVAGALGVAAIALGANAAACNALACLTCALTLWASCFVSWRSVLHTLPSAAAFA